MPLLRLDKISLAHGHRPLLDEVQLELYRDERVCLVGRNGEGKSSLIRLIQGETTPDTGSRWLRPGMGVAHLAQEVGLDSQGSVFDVVASGLPEVGHLLSQYHQAAGALAKTGSTADQQRLAQLQHALETAGGWHVEQRVEAVLSRLRIDGDVALSTLSGGWQRRVMLARALVTDPDILLLDEPTNHLDIEAIAWLEEFMLDYRGALLFVSHDRAFVRRLATRIIELDRGQLTSWPGNYDEYLRRKADQLEVEARHNALFDKKLSEEESWIRQGIKARRTRNEGRVRALKGLREERRLRRERAGKVGLNLAQGELSGKLVFEAEQVCLSFAGNDVIHNFSARIWRGDRVGIIGPNGAGKSTLIKLLLGELAPDSGQIHRGTRLQSAYFDQQREQLDVNASVMDSVAEGSSHVTVNGRSVHVAGYLRNFLFPAERLRSPVSTLSGGERNRLLLARLFTQPANLLVLDEPTNDLDIETLELLEELLMEYEGTLLLVSHDRAFLDNVVTSTLAFEKGGRVGDYVGGYTDWLRQTSKSSAQKRQSKPSGTHAKENKDSATKKRNNSAKKISYKDQRELDQLPAKIEALEREQQQLQQRVSTPGFYQQQDDAIAETLAQLNSVSDKLAGCYERWETLESLI